MPKQIITLHSNENNSRFRLTAKSDTTHQGGVKYLSQNNINNPKNSKNSEKSEKIPKIRKI